MGAYSLGKSNHFRPCPKSLNFSNFEISDLQNEHFEGFEKLNSFGESSKCSLFVQKNQKLIFSWFWSTFTTCQLCDFTESIKTKKSIYSARKQLNTSFSMQEWTFSTTYPSQTIKSDFFFKKACLAICEEKKNNCAKHPCSLWEKVGLYVCLSVAPDFLRVLWGRKRRGRACYWARRVWNVDF